MKFTSHIFIFVFSFIIASDTIDTLRITELSEILLKKESDNLIQRKGYLKEALKLQESIGAKYRMIHTLTFLGITNYNLGELSESLQNFLKSLEYAKDFKFNQKIPNLYNWISRIYLLVGDGVKAKKYLMLAYENSTEDVTEGTTALVMMAENEFSYNNIEKALELIQEAVSWQDDEYKKQLKYNPENDYMVYTHKTKLLKLKILELTYKYELENNESYLRSKLKHISELKEIYFDDPMARIDNKVGSILQKGYIFSQLNDFKSSQISFTYSLDLSHENGYLQGEIKSYIALGELYLGKNNFENSEKNIFAALKLATKKNLYDYEFQILNTISKLFLKQNKLDSAYVYLNKSINNYLDNQNSQLNIKLRYRGQKTILTEIYLQMIKLLISQQKLEEAFKYIEELKSQNMVRILEDSGFNNQNMPYEQFYKERLLKVDLEYLNKRIRDLNISQSGIELLDSLNNARTDKRKALQYVREKYLINNPKYQFNSGYISSIELKKAQRLLKKDEIALYLLQIENTIVTLIVERNSIKTKTINIDNILLNQLINIIIGREKGDLFEVLEQLYSLLIAPLAEEIRYKNRICILPTGQLHYIPFHALFDKINNKYLIESYSIYYNFSLTVLDWLRDTGTFGRSDILLIGNCKYKSDNIINPSYSNVRGLLNQLPESEKEVKEISDLYYPKVKLLTGEMATESNIKKEIGNYGIIHFATHAIVDEINPMYSAIICSYDNRDDGFLEAHEIRDLDLNADIVILSACKTAFGKVINGDGMNGLSRSFFNAGVPTVVSTLWSVHDNASKKIMIEFHKQLKKGIQPADALRESQILMIHSEKFTHPKYWAPFLLSGDSE